MTLDFTSTDTRSAAAAQFGSIGTSLFQLAATPGNINTATPSGMRLCNFLKSAISAAQGALNGTIPDPFAALGGVYAFRSDRKSPGPLYFEFPIETQVGGGNWFWGLQ